MVEWLRVGFVHGVMNTDNMSILGLTIDYGPYSFVDDYDPNFTPNTTDLPGRRYAFGRQPAIGKWNLGCLGGAIAPLLPDTVQLVQALDGYDDFYWRKYYRMMADKIGLDDVRPEDVDLFRQFEKTLTALKADMTIFYQLLTNYSPLLENQEDVVSHFEESFYNQPKQQEREMLYDLMKGYTNRIKTNTITTEESQNLMRVNNPRVILRNYLLHQSIEDLEKGDDTLFKKLQEAMKEPYSNNHDEFFAKRPTWAGNKAGCSMLSCSS
jgi:uncharacterized protein YdiU (UPF0061 family)